MAKVDPAEIRLNFALSTKTNLDKAYIDLAECLSFVNRRLYEQGKCYYVTDVSIQQVMLNATTYGKFSISTLPDTWITANAWVKSKALWNSMNKKVLRDSPGVKGTWSDYKVFFDGAHANDTIAGTVNLLPCDGQMTGSFPTPTRPADSEWIYSEFVAPQHEVDPTTGEPIAADEYYGHMLGIDQGTVGSHTSVGIIKGYQDTRSRVQKSPDVPAELSTSWMTLLTDDGSQEPELAQVIEDANDYPPYPQDDYAGSGTFYQLGVQQSMSMTGAYNPQIFHGGMKVPLGLLKLEWQSDAPAFLSITMMPGTYKGVMTTEMKQ